MLKMKVRAMNKLCSRPKAAKEDTVVISTHGLIKKTGKVPKGEIEKARKLMDQYFQEKKEKGRKK
jgi:hypothetical protein